jgi:biopolymer transport protein TolR
MAMAGMQRGAGKRFKYKPLSEINVTPLVDVMLVLLIVFMVAAPLLTVGVQVNLPETRAEPLQGDTEPLAITVTVDGVIYLQDTEVAFDELVPRLQAIAANGYDQRIFVRGDEAVPYGEVVKIMGTMTAAGFRNIALVTESLEE